MVAMRKNKKNFFIGIICSGILFMISVLYLTIPSYYGIEQMASIDTNNLFISMMLVYSVLHFVHYILIGANPNKESIYMSIAGSTAGLLNVLFGIFYPNNAALPMSFAIFVLIITGIKLFTIDYYHDRKDVYYYFETMFLLIFFIVGIVSSFNLFSDSILQTMMLGYYFIVVAIVEALNNSIKSMLKSKRFLRKIKLK